MGDFFITTAFFFSLISPIFAYRTGQKWLGRVNMLTLLVFVVSFLSVHGFVMYNTWLVAAMFGLFFLNLLFAIINSSMFIHDRHPRASVVKVVGTVSVIFLGCLLTAYYFDLHGEWWETIIGATVPTVTLFVTGVLLLHLKQLDQQPEA
ncbi:MULTISPECIES: hypothetical protein [Exiguobacterium]|uniref:hypothetical protein n=1 Tax=Exiguobacterium TaxID=33986 RepID=UPI0004A8D4DF|nr:MULTISPECIES: hypothetical protein [Exiguobacterium]KDN58088.1 hypothetical protein DI14_14510 [Exiguobacterium sp. AB2]QUE86403.1 hypothetical protein KB235_00210 [Exiguobacterium alkaliphilum]